MPVVCQTRPRADVGDGMSNLRVLHPHDVIVSLIAPFGPAVAWRVYAPTVLDFARSLSHTLRPEAKIILSLVDETGRGWRYDVPATERDRCDNWLVEGRRFGEEHHCFCGQHVEAEDEAPQAGGDLRGF